MLIKKKSNLKQRLVAERENFKLEAEKLQNSTNDKVLDAKNRYIDKTNQREGEFNTKPKN